jgi:hypothetical protein
MHVLAGRMHCCSVHDAGRQGKLRLGVRAGQGEREHSGGSRALYLHWLRYGKDPAPVSFVEVLVLVVW